MTSHRERRRPAPLFPAKFRNRRDFDENGIKWGSHEADALQRAAEITLEELQFMNMTVESATDWASWYEEECALNPESSQDEIETRLTLANSDVAEMQFVLEPWGRLYVLAPGDEFELVFKGPGVPKPEVVWGKDAIKVYGWIGTTVDVFCNGEELTEYVRPKPHAEPSRRAKQERTERLA